MGKAGQARQVFRTYGKTKSASKVKSTEKKTPGQQKLKKGSVLIMLAGRFRGRRAVFLKQLASGLLLVTGPYAVNGVPLRRVNQRMCIGTSTKVDLKGADFGKVDDAYFAKNAAAKKGKKDEMFSKDSPKSEMSAEKKAGQKTMDDAIVKGLGADHKAYLKARFSLSSKMYPHELKF
mmetsp:Transcript_103957/g.279259  ORF Transcript_103957/g.279259 Transcript_103957/m.279259 type:complete len:177 (+) Transcript_103957:105-635(+)